MNIDIKDTLTLSDNNCYVVVSKVNYGNNTYYYLIDKPTNESVKFCVERPESNALLEIEDKNLIQRLLPLFLEASYGAITKEDLELITKESE